MNLYLIIAAIVGLLYVVDWQKAPYATLSTSILAFVVGGLFWPVSIWIIFAALARHNKLK